MTDLRTWASQVGSGRPPSLVIETGISKISAQPVVSVRYWPLPKAPKSQLVY